MDDGKLDGWEQDGLLMVRQFPEKETAIAAVADIGFTEHVGTSESGDWGVGSREYFCRPGAERNQYGYPLEAAVISKVYEGEWWANFPALEPAPQDGPATPGL